MGKNFCHPSTIPAKNGNTPQGKLRIDAELAMKEPMSGSLSGQLQHHMEFIRQLSSPHVLITVITSAVSLVSKASCGEVFL